MKLTVISYKVCWAVAGDDSVNYVTTGGFPYQLRAVADLFDETTAVLVQTDRPPVAGLKPLTAQTLAIKTVPEPASQGFARKIGLLFWLIRNIGTLWREVAASDAVHIPVPGDISVLGVLVALIQRKPLFVRHCGTWGEPVTITDRLLLKLLERVAGGHTVVMATGGAPTPPSTVNQAVSWIHSTSLTQNQIESTAPANTWQTGESLRLITVGRVSEGKNMEVAIRALPKIRSVHPEARLTILGEGPKLEQLKVIVTELNLTGAVDFRGNVSHAVVLETLRDSHLFLFPTKVKEGFPKAVLEAMACGLPVIATGVSVLPYLIGRVNGQILETPTAESVAESVLALTANPEQLAQMGHSARETSKQYTLEKWQEIIKMRLEKAWGRSLKGE